jgi:hypothetical protein
MKFYYVLEVDQHDDPDYRDYVTDDFAQHLKVGDTVFCLNYLDREKIEGLHSTAMDDSFGFFGRVAQIRETRLPGVKMVITEPIE